MKMFIAICVLLMVGLSSPATIERSHRDCFYVMGKCQKECEEGTHIYEIKCGRRTPEPTCSEPNPEQEEAIICDFSTCHCDAPTVRDTSSRKCVALDKCPKKTLESDSKDIESVDSVM